GFRERYRYCQRRAQQVNRFDDPTYRQQIIGLSLDKAIQVYGEVLAKLQAEYVEQNKVQAALLFKHGLGELRFALTDGSFYRLFLQGNVPEAGISEIIGAFQTDLDANWADRPVKRVADAQGLARDIALAAQRTLGLKPSLVVLELACGACAALDECTSYLTPGQYREVNASLKWEAGGIGLEVTISKNRDLVVASIDPRGPAARTEINVGDKVIRIGSKSFTNVGPEDAANAADLLRGDADTTVELEVKDRDNRPHVVTLRRQILRIPSVSEPRLLDRDRGIGYVQLLAFPENTLEELNEAIAKLQSLGMRALILDLRGNPGGLFEVARQVVERFVAAGVIVSTEGRVSSEFNATYHARGTNVLDTPLVVLVDGETA